jgi:hypothetical protein
MQCFSIAATHDAQVMPCTCIWHLAKSFLSNTTWSSLWALVVFSGLADFDTLGSNNRKNHFNCMSTVSNNLRAYLR